MKKLSLIKRPILLILGSLSMDSATLTAAISTEQKGEWYHLKNDSQELAFNTKNGLFYILDHQGRKVIDYAYFRLGGLQSKDTGMTLTARFTPTQDTLGKGACLLIEAKKDKQITLLWTATLYDEQDYMVFNMGVQNDSGRDYRLMSYYPLISTKSYTGTETGQNYRALDGLAGGGKTQVVEKDYIQSFNNLMVKWGDIKAPHIFIAGGITYHEFEKFISAKRGDKNLTLTLWADDPVGKLIPEGTRFLSKDQFYIHLNATNPFDGLEQYGQTLKKAQDIALNMYDFPTECLWYASFYNNQPGKAKFNNSTGAISEMDEAIRTGITEYTRVGIRLVPDAYGPNNQQGWWDDEHWGLYNEKMSTDEPHYTKAHPTTKSWASAIKEKGGIPITYMQSARRSEDFAEKYPEYMLFNESFKAITQPDRFLHRIELSEEYGEGIGGYFNHWWTDKMLWSYDFTDPGFLNHMKTVYKNLNDGDVAGVMYDYPEVTAWAFEGGFEDNTATTAYAYRQMFKVAYEGLGKGCYLDERNLLRGSDINLGLLASQRVWADTDSLTPEMVNRCGLRWYKNRVVINYDMDSKDLADEDRSPHRDKLRALLTMTYVTSGRFLLANSFAQLSPDQRKDMSRCFPYHTNAQSARPLDAFTKTGPWCRIYDYAVNNDWHQLTFYNPEEKTETSLTLPLSATLNEGGPALSPEKSYHIYDFWNDCYRGTLSGKDTLTQTLRPSEARMLSLHAIQPNPQWIATNRHLMQGYLDIKKSAWNEKERTLNGTSHVVKNDPYVIVIAHNGATPKSIHSSSGTATLTPIEGTPGFSKVTLLTDKSQDIDWTLLYE